jgi:hypothetical protein
MTPGGVGGSKVVYFKESGGRISKAAMRDVVHKFSQFKAQPPAKAAKPVKGVPALPIPKAEDKKFRAEAAKFLKELAAFKAKLAQKKAQKEGKPLSEIERGKAPGAKVAAAKIKSLMKQLENEALPEIVKEAILAQIELLRNQFPDFRKFLRSDFMIDDSVLTGVITRAGPFQYGDQVKIKDWNNLLNVFGQVTHFPAFDAHDEHRLVGFTHSFELDGETELVHGKAHTFEDIAELSDLTTPTNLPVSIRFYDQGARTDGVQDITDVLHLAISFNKTDQDRCSSLGGHACTLSPESHLSNLQQTQAEDDFMANDEDKKKKKTDEEEEEDEDQKDMDTSLTDFLKVYGYPNKEEFIKVFGVNKEDFTQKFVAKADYDALSADLKTVKDFVVNMKAKAAAKQIAKLASLRADLISKHEIKEDFITAQETKWGDSTYDFLKAFHDGLPEPKEVEEDFSHHDPFSTQSDFKAQEENIDAIIKKRFPAANLGPGGALK